MLSKKMLSVIEEFSEQILKENPFALAAQEGLVTEQQITTYLQNLRWVFKNNTAYLKFAEQRAEQLSLFELKNFFQSKYKEEIGHEQWAEEDLKHREVQNSTNSDFILPSTRRLIAYLHDLIHADPNLFLAYMLFTEYFTVIVGPRFLSLLENQCGIPRSEVSSIGKHVEADQAHTTEDAEIIDHLVYGTSHSAAMMEALYGSIVRIDCLLAECVGIAQ
jgi:pyrroloquinoline quinone (PQQ) biosynthesis protein C